MINLQPPAIRGHGHQCGQGQQRGATHGDSGRSVGGTVNDRFSGKIGQGPFSAITVVSSKMVVAIIPTTQGSIKIKELS